MKKILFIILISSFGFLPLFAVNDARLEMIGILGGQNLYLSYSELGLLAQCYNSSVYDASFITKMAKGTSVSCRKARSAVQNLIDLKILTNADAEWGRNMIAAYDALSDEADALMSLAETPSTEAANLLERNKNKAWSKVDLVLQFEN